MAQIRICETMVHPRLVSVPSETTDGVEYTVVTATMFNESICECKAWEFSKPKREPAHCKHADRLDAERCYWHVKLDEETEKITTCPDCGAPAITFNPEPEFD